MSAPRQTGQVDFAIAALAGLAGAAGVILASVAAHSVQDPALVTAANFLIMHAAAVLAVMAIAIRSTAAAAWWRGTGAALLAGVVLFSGDIATRKIAGHGLFPMAAPAGGILVIAGWAGIAVAAVLDWRRT